MNNDIQELSLKEKRRMRYKIWHRENYKENREQILKQNREYYQKKKDKIIECSRLYNKNNKEKNAERAKKYYQKIKNNPEMWQRALQRASALRKKKRKTDPLYHIEETLRNRLNTAIRNCRAIKKDRTLNLLGCTKDKLRQHIESQWQPGMTWENYTLTGWHIDHIKPCNTFDLTDPEQQRQCFHYTNLRPLWAKDNLTRPHDGSDIMPLEVATHQR